MKGTTALNVLGLIVAAPLLGYSLAHSGPGELAHNTEAYLANASVGMSAGVSANPYNSLAVELNAKEAELEDREAKLTSQSHGGDMLGVYSLIMSCILLVLVAINFYLDMRRSRKISPSLYAVNLRQVR